MRLMLGTTLPTEGTGVLMRGERLGRLDSWLIRVMPVGTPSSSPAPHRGTHTLSDAAVRLRSSSHIPGLGITVWCTMRGQSLWAMRMDFSCCTSERSMSTSCCSMLFISSMSLDFLSRLSTHTFFLALHLLAAALGGGEPDATHTSHTPRFNQTCYVLRTFAASLLGLPPQASCHV